MDCLICPQKFCGSILPILDHSLPQRVELVKLAAQPAWNARWDKHLKNDAFEPTFTPTYGLFLNDED